MTARLAVFSNDIGASFIEFHLSDLAPGRTVGVGALGAPEFGNLWPPSCPVLKLDPVRTGFVFRGGRRLGLRESWMMDAVVTRFLRKHRVSIVLGEYLDTFIDFVPLMDRLNMPYVVQGHGVDVSAALRRPGMGQRYLAYASAKAILTRNELHQRRLASLGLPAEKIHINHGGVTVPAKVTKRPAAASKRFLALGRMVDKKGPIYLLEAFRIAARSDPEITLDWIGAGQLFGAAAQYVEAADLRDRVTLHGVAPEELKQRLFAECGVFVQHSVTDPATGDEEGLPAAIQEAMAQGMAVVSTRHAGIPEAVIENKTGYLVDERDVRGMAEAILAATATSAEMGEAGHSEALAKHAWHHEQARLKHWLFEPA